MITLHGTGNATHIANVISQELQAGSLSCEMVESFARENTVIMVFEKFYYRNSSRASLTVAVTQSGERVTVDAVASGGGNGTFFGFDWGAGGNFEDSVRHILSNMGFR